MILLFASHAITQEPLLVGSSQGAGEPVDLTVWSAFDGASLDWLASQLDIWGRATGQAIEITVWSVGELRQRVMLEAELGTAADLFVGVPHDSIAELIADELLADVSSFATADYLSDLPEQAALAFASDGMLLGLPLALEGPALIVNTDRARELPESYDDLIELAVAYNSGGNSGFMFDVDNFYFSYAWLRSFGGWLFGRDAVGNHDPDDIGLASPGALQGAKALRDLRFVHSLLPVGIGYADIRERFAAGQLAFVYDGPWSVSAYFASGVPLLVVPMPEVAPGQPWRGFMSVTGVLVNEHAQDRIGAANAAKWLVREEAQVELARDAGRIPASMSAVDAISDDELLHGFGMALREAEAVPNTVNMPRLWRPLGEALLELTTEPLSDSEVLLLLERLVETIRFR